MLSVNYAYCINAKCCGAAMTVCQTSICQLTIGEYELKPDYWFWELTPPRPISRYNYAHTLAGGSSIKHYRLISEDSV
jgi:hypothetical protein